MDVLVGLMTQYKTTLLLGGLVLMWFLEHWLPFYEGEDFEHPIPHDARNLTLALINFGVIALAFAWMTRWSTSWSAANHFGLLRWAGLEGLGMAVAAVLLMDCWLYWWHRAVHVFTFFWRFHRVHHSDPAMDASTGLRFHFGEVALSAVTRAAFLFVLGLELWQVVLYEAIMTPLVLLHHSNVNLGKIDDWMRTVIVSPNMHRVHHSRKFEEFNSNFSIVLSIWDRLFGTYNGRRDVEKIKLGLKDWDGEEWQCLGGLLKSPLR